MREPLELTAAVGMASAGRPALLWDTDRLILVRKVFVENEPSRLQVVSYRVVAGQLVRRESPGTRDLIQIEQLWQAIASDAAAENAPSVVLQVGVVGMQVQGWQNNVWRNEPTAVGGGTPDPAGTDLNAKNAQDPTGVQVALTVQGLAQPMVKAFLLGGT